MIKVFPNGPTTKGIDVSHWESSIDWKLQIANGVKFCFAKATEGVSNSDQSFQKHWLNMKAFGLVRGAYHFFHPSQDPVMQAHHFISSVGPLGAKDLLVMDWESTDEIPASQDVKNGFDFLTTVEKLTGKVPLIYTGPFFGEALSLPESFNKYPLWIAHYGATAPLVPAPWVSWQFWQFTETNIDTNLFNGSLDQLKALS